MTADTFMGIGMGGFTDSILLHHLVERLGVSLYDYAFLASGLIFIIGGIIAIRTAGDEQSPSSPAVNDGI